VLKGHHLHVEDVEEDVEVDGVDVEDVEAVIHANTQI
jgi:hypothetical protein